MNDEIDSFAVEFGRELRHAFCKRGVDARARRHDTDFDRAHP